MARGVNKVILIGNCGSDPETRYGASGTPITSLSLATTESWKDKATGENVEKTEWHRVKLFSRLAEIASEYLRKGSQVYIEGRIQTDKYTDKDGVERFSTNIIANELQLLGGRPQGDGEAPSRAPAGERPRPAARPAPAGGGGGGYAPRGESTGRPAPARANSAPPPADDFEDDIPF